MKNATWIIVATLMVPTAVWATQPGEDEEALMVAQALPGMRETPHPTPLNRLPGMTPAPARVAALPTPVISDVTNYPNPFDSRKAGHEGETTISYQLGQDAKVTIDLFDLLGHKVRGWSLAAGSNGGRNGLNNLTWDGTNEAGQKVSKGGYIAQIVIETPQTTATVVRKIGVIH